MPLRRWGLKSGYGLEPSAAKDLMGQEVYRKGLITLYIARNYKGYSPKT
jgi:hypothetical protein